MVLTLYEEIKNVDLPKDLKKVFDRKRHEREKKQLTVEAKKDQIKMLKERDGMTQEQIEAMFKRESEILIQEQETGAEPGTNEKQ